MLPAARAPSAVFRPTARWCSHLPAVPLPSSSQLITSTDNALVPALNADVKALDLWQGSTTSSERLAKVLARAGFGSRRSCERLITTGAVRVNGQQLWHPAVTIGPDDRIVVAGKPVAGQTLAAQKRPRLFLVHKLRGELVTHADPRGRPTVLGRLLGMGLPEGLVTVGRLDFNTEGLLLCTNNGDLARYLEHPAAGFTRVYRAQVWMGGPRGAKQVDKAVCVARWLAG